MRNGPIAFVWLCLYCASFGQLSTEYALTTWTKDQGLPQNTVRRIVQGRDGFIWLATEEGVARFDGDRFIVIDRNSSPSLGASFVWTVEPAAAGGVWAGTDGAGLARIVGARVVERWTALNGLPHDVVTAIVELPDGSLWVGTRQGLARMANGTWQTFKVPEELSHSYVRALAVDREGQVWVGTVRGVHVLSPDGARHSSMEKLAAVDVRALAVSDDGAVWVGTNGSGLFRVLHDAVEHFHEGSGLPSNTISGLSASAGRLWISMYGGGVAEFRDGEFRVLRSSDGLPHDLALSIFAAEGRVWAGLNAGGLVQLQRRRVSVLGVGEGLRHPIALPVLEDRRGVIWAGSPAGVHRIDSGRVSHYPLTAQGGIVLSLAEDRAGRIWAGLAPSGLFRWEGGEFSEVKSAALEGQTISVLAADPVGSMWVGTDAGGLFILDSENTATRRVGLPSDSISSILFEPDGSAWIGTNGNGLFRVRGERVESHLQKPDQKQILAIQRERDGTLWVGTGSGGLQRFRDDVWHQFSTSEGLLDSLVGNLLEDDLGYLWLGSNHGLTRIRKSDLQDIVDGRRTRVNYLLVDRADGMRSGELNSGVSPSAWKDAGGHLWFPTAAGLVRVDPKSVAINTVPPRIFIEAAMVDGKETAFHGALQVPRTAKQLEFRYTSPVFRAAHRVQFRFRVVGYDSEWQEAGSRRSAFYSKLPPGSYAFEVLACNEDGIWADQPARLAFEVEWAFYDTAWFQGVVFLAVLLSGLGVYQWRVRRLERAREDLRRAVTERTAELQHANQELERQFLRLQRVESIGMLSSGIAHDLNNVITPIMMGAALLRTEVQRPDNIRVLESMERAAGRAANLVQQILRFARGVDREQRLLSVADVLNDIRLVIAETFPKSVDLRVSVAPDAEPFTADPTQVHQVLLNLCVNARDAMPNGGVLSITAQTISWTSADAAAVRGARAGRWTVFQVSDTGSGIPPEVLAQIWEPFFSTKPLQQGTGLGLATVAAIVTAHKGFALVETATGKGTTLKVFFPVTQQTADTVPASEVRLVRGKGGGAMVLLVDDEPAIRDTAAGILRSDGYQVLLAVSAEQAIEHLAARPQIRILITDLDMPGGSGRQLVDRVRDAGYRLGIVIMSGGNMEPLGADVLHLAKPFSAADLLVIVAAAARIGE